jgi:Zn finger protein HypA/HybF involved in hydrogenase expression
MSTVLTEDAPAIVMDEKAQEAHRTCLGCDEVFLSHSPGNRICPACKRRRRRVKPFGCRVWHAACSPGVLRALESE